MSEAKHPSGPFFLRERSNAVCRRGRPGSQHVLTFPYRMDRGEMEEMVALLNKGTRFDALLEAVKGAVSYLRHGIYAIKGPNAVMQDLKAAIAETEKD